MASKDITSPGGSGDLDSISKPGEGLTVEETIRRKKNLTNDNRDRGNIEQYILSQNIDKVNNFYNSRKDLFNYLTFRQVNGDGTQIVNKLRGIDNVGVFYNIKNTVLSLMQPKVRIYKVNFEETVFAEDGTPDQGKTEPLPTPCYKEFKFADSFGLGSVVSVSEYLKHETTKPNWRNVGLKSFTIKQDGESLGVLENNIECSMSIIFKSLKDVNAQPPGEPHFTKGGLRYVDLILWPPSRYVKDAETYNPKHYIIKVLMGYTSPSKQALQSLNLSAEEVKMVNEIEKLNTIVSLTLVDYNLDIQEDGQVLLTANYRGHLETMVGTNQVNIFQDTRRMGKAGKGQISKTADPKNNPAHIYKIISMIHSFYKELNEPGCKDDKCTSRKKLREVLESDLVFSSVFEEAGGPATTKRKGVTKIIGDGEEIYLWFKQKANADKMLAITRRRVGMFKKDIYKTFVDQLITGNDQRGDGPPETRLFCINVPKHEVIKHLGGIEETPIKRQQTVESLTNQGASYEEAMQQILEGGTTAIPKGQPQIKVGRCNQLISSDANLKSEVAQDINALSENQTGSTDKNTGDRKKDPSRTTTLNFDGENYKFYFVYLGDIIELACKNAGFKALDLIDANAVGDEFFQYGSVQTNDSGEQTSDRAYPPFTETSYYGYNKKKGELNKDAGLNYGLNNMRILLGPIEYFDEKTGKIKTINLAQFPISFNYFRAWFLKTIIRKKRASMPLGDFLTQCINDLVIPAMGVGMPSSIRLPKSMSSIVAMALPGRQTDEAPINICGRMVGKTKELLPLHRTIDVDGPVFKELYLNALGQGQSSESMIKTSYDYLLIYVTTVKNLRDRRGNPNEDLKDGIYHFNIGSDRGLLTKMNFERVALPGLAEARYREAIENGGSNLEQLKFPYHTNLDLVGNSLFTPGMFYYVNPSMAGLGSVEDASSLAYQMNLGGYHLIGTVTNTFSAGTYTTKVTGWQQTPGKPR